MTFKFFFIFNSACQDKSRQKKTTTTTTAATTTTQDLWPNDLEGRILYNFERLFDRQNVIHPTDVTDLDLENYIHSTEHICLVLAWFDAFYKSTALPRDQHELSCLFSESISTELFFTTNQPRPLFPHSLPTSTTLSEKEAADVFGSLLNQLLCLACHHARYRVVVELSKHYSSLLNLYYDNNLPLRKALSLPHYETRFSMIRSLFEIGFTISKNENHVLIRLISKVVENTDLFEFLIDKGMSIDDHDDENYYEYAVASSMLTFNPTLFFNSIVRRRHLTFVVAVYVAQLNRDPKMCERLAMHNPLAYYIAMKELLFSLQHRYPLSTVSWPSTYQEQAKLKDIYFHYGWVFFPSLFFHISLFFFISLF